MRNPKRLALIPVGSGQPSAAGLLMPKAANVDFLPMFLYSPHQARRNFRVSKDGVTYEIG
jgi:hypothetical protein